ncbi:hypothetical protein CL619_01610 [archaeon]|nr:hypothetical protein [archaeon]|tara:strand:- start:3490 stop:4077 length:588 start_codon:yes stop_codon:yes gene_type:complete
MLRKTFCTIAKAKNLPQDQAICIKTDSASELQEALKLLDSRESLKGVQISSNFLPSFLSDKNCNFVSILLKDREDSNLILKYLIPKNQFIELIIPFQIYTESLLKSLQGVKRVIVDFSKTNKEQVTQEEIKTLFAELISNKYFPFTLGLTQNQVQLRHMVEFYQDQITTNQVAGREQHAASSKEFLEQRTEGDIL